MYWGEKMDKNNMVIIALIVVILALLVGMFAMANHAKEDTKIAITGNSTLHEGDSIDVKLTDLNGTPLSNQTINITITDKNNTGYYYSVVTNEKGVGKLKLDKSEGNYTVNCTFGGNENFTGNTTTKEIRIEKEVDETQSSSSSSSSNSASASSSGSSSGSSSSDEYVYSAQGDKYIKKSGQWDSDGRGNSVYSYQGSDGVIYERYYDSNGKEIDPNVYYM